MKKLLLLLALAAVSMTRCTEGLVDYDCTVVCEIENRTESEVIYTVERPAHKSTTIFPHQTLQIFKGSGLCTKSEGEKLADYYEKLYYPFELMFDPASNFLTSSDQPVPDTIWRSEFWDFTTIPFKIKFTLTLTNELIETLLSEEEQ
jgi:hypothetical protein